jgi:hypothetical protein
MGVPCWRRVDRGHVTTESGVMAQAGRYHAGPRYKIFFPLCLTLLFAVLGNEPRALCVLGKCFTTELHPSPTQHFCHPLTTIPTKPLTLQTQFWCYLIELGQTPQVKGSVPQDWQVMGPHVTHPSAGLAYKSMVPIPSTQD